MEMEREERVLMECSSVNCEPFIEDRCNKKQLVKSFTRSDRF